MTAAKFGDPVLGIDIHQVMIPMPAPTPVPIPHPFVGAVFDPLGAAIGSLIAAFSGGGPVLVNSMPCGNTGTEVKGFPHIPITPLLQWGPSDKPDNSGTLITGSKTVHFMGASESREASHVSSCGWPLNLPTSVCLPIATGSPVNIGGPEAVDWMAAVTRAIRTKWMSGMLKKVLGEGPIMSKVICFLTGHPVDVMTGELIAEAVDFEIPGLIPIVWERNYRSRQTREGALGAGWTHPFDEWVEEVPEGIILWLADGRPKHHPALTPGQSHWDAQDRYTVTRERDGYEVRSQDGLRRAYRRVHPESRGRRSTQFGLTEIRDRASNRVALKYERGYLVRVVDTAGRELEVRWTKTLRVEGVYFEDQPLVRYHYDDEHRLAAAEDPLGHALRYEYAGGVLVEETHKSGLAFHFEWDWEDPAGWCIRTWGENPDAATQPGQPEAVPRYIYDRRITYDAENHFTSVKDGRGGITQYWGNGAGLVEKVMDPSGVVATYTWSDSYQKTSEADADGNKTEWEYDERGNCVVERDPLGLETRRSYDEHDQLVRIVDPAGGQWKISWGQQGKAEWIQNPLGFATRYEHDEHGRPLRVEDPMGREVRMAWSERHDLERVTDGEKRATMFVHDALGRIVGSEDAGGRTARANRDACGRVTYLERADGEILWLTLDAEGNVVEESDAQGRKVQMKYSGMRRLVEHRDPMGYRVRLAYDSEEELVAVENQAGERYRFELDRAGRVNEEVSFDGKKFRYIYDKSGRTVRILSADYLVTMLERDPLGRVTKRSMKAPSNRGVVAPELEEESFAFDPRGDLISATTRAASTSFERDSLGRILREHHTRQGALPDEGQVTRMVENRYDLSGLRIERDTDMGHRTQYQWDGSGLLSGLKAGPSRTLEAPSIQALQLASLRLPEWEMKIARDPLGLEIARRLPGGVVAMWKRDALGRPSERSVLSGAFPGREAKEVAHVGYQWKSADQIAALIDTEKGATRFDYDPRGHLIAAMFPDGTTQLRTSDAVSNVYKTPNGSDRTYGRGGRLERVGNTEYRYDGHGNLTEKILADGARWIYRWSPAGRLDEVVRPDGRTVRFAYDALGRRVRKEFEGTVTEFVWDGDDLVHEKVTRADGTGPAITTWVFEPGAFAPVAKLEGAKRYSVVTDHLGTPTEMLNEAGKLAWRAQLDVWGVPREDLDSIAQDERAKNPWRYPGQYQDEETGLYYNRFRYYDPEAGRYIGADPVGLRGGEHQYAYVSDPCATTDPYGLSDADALRQLARELSNNPRRGLPPLLAKEAQTLIDWADEYGVKVRASERDLGLHGHVPNWEPRLGPHSIPTPTPHIHIGADHVPVEPGFSPRGGCR